MIRLFLPTILVLGTASCELLPASGPTSEAMQQSVAASAAEVSQGYLVVPVDAETIARLATRPEGSLHDHFASAPAPRQMRVGTGDRITVTIWEAGPGGLFTPASADAVTGSSSVSLPEQEVGVDGAITVPYAGRVQARGATPAQIEQRIIAALTGRAIEPQVIVSLAQNTANLVTISGTAGGGARVPLTSGGNRILDVIAMAGGAPEPQHSVMVALERRGRIMQVPLVSLTANPRENIAVAPGDTITLTRTVRTFTALGATRQNALVPFDSATMTLDKAVAAAGGLSDALADPGAVFVLRREASVFANVLNPTFVPLPGQNMVNVIYNVDFRSAEGLFLARQFEVQPDDILYVSGATANALEKFLRLLQAPFLTARVINPDG